MTIPSQSRGKGTFADNREKKKKVTASRDNIRKQKMYSVPANLDTKQEQTPTLRLDRQYIKT